MSRDRDEEGAPVGAYAYRLSRARWRYDTADGTARGRLLRYLAGGGMRSLGRTVRQDEADERAQRFLSIAAVVAVLWLYFWW